jgi:dCTP deaminase
MGLLPDWMIEREVKIEPFSPQMERKGIISYGVTSYGYDVRAGYKWKLFDVLAGGIVDPKNFDPKLLREVDLTPCHEPIELSTGVICRRCSISEQRWDSYDSCKDSLHPNFITIPPNSYVLGESMETFTIPRDMGVICIGKSTYARCGIIVNVTPGEPEWTGKWTIEISNSSPLPAKVYCGEGIMQCMFIRSDGYRARLWDIIRILLATRDMSNFRMAITEAQNIWNRGKLMLSCDKSYADKKGKYQNQGGIKLPEVK